MKLDIRPARPADAAALAKFAADTFPLACPPDAPAAAIDAFVSEHLGQGSFTRYLADPQRQLFVAQEIATEGEGALMAYSMMVDAPPSDNDVAAVVTEPDAVELSKCYAHPDVHGHGVSAQLMQASLAWIDKNGARSSWLGVNTANKRAQKFYGKHGFTVVGTRSFHLGKRVEHDYVMVRPKKK